MIITVDLNGVDADPAYMIGLAGLILQNDKDILAKNEGLTRKHGDMYINILIEENPKLVENEDNESA